MLASSQCPVSLPCSDTDWFVIVAYPGHTQVLYGNLVNKFKGIMEKLIFPDQFKKIIRDYLMAFWLSPSTETLLSAREL